MGTINLSADPWANVYLGKRKIGMAPQVGLRLPVGRHRLKLVNPDLDSVKWIEVQVPSKEVYRVSMK